MLCSSFDDVWAEFVLMTCDRQCLTYALEEMSLTPRQKKFFIIFSVLVCCGMGCCVAPCLLFTAIEEDVSVEEREHDLVITVEMVNRLADMALDEDSRHSKIVKTRMFDGSTDLEYDYEHETDYEYVSILTNVYYEPSLDELEMARDMYWSLGHAGLEGLGVLSEEEHQITSHDGFYECCDLVRFESIHVVGDPTRGEGHLLMIVKGHVIITVQTWGLYIPDLAVWTAMLDEIMPGFEQYP